MDERCLLVDVAKHFRSSNRDLLRVARDIVGLPVWADMMTDCDFVDAFGICGIRDKHLNLPHDVDEPLRRCCAVFSIAHQGLPDSSKANLSKFGQLQLCKPGADARGRFSLLDGSKERPLQKYVKSRFAEEPWSYHNQTRAAVPTRVVSVVVVHAHAVGDECPFQTRRRWTFRLHIRGYDVGESGFFTRLQVSPSGQNLLLFSPGCIVVSLLPPLIVVEPADYVLEDFVILKPQDLRAHPPNGDHFVKAMWHPLSENHVAVVLYSGVFQLYEVTKKRRRIEPEIEFVVTFGRDTQRERVVDFVAFTIPNAAVAVWSSSSLCNLLAVIFVSSNGRLAFRNPVLPSACACPTSAVDKLRRSMNVRPQNQRDQYVPSPAMRAFLRDTIFHPEQANFGLAPKDTGDTSRRFTVISRGGGTFNSKWMPAEQIIHSKGRPPCEGCRCALWLPDQPLPLLVVARKTGLVEVLVVNQPLFPRFHTPEVERGSEDLIHVSTVEEIDLGFSSPAVCLQLSPMASQHRNRRAFLVRSEKRVVRVEIAVPVWVPPEPGSSPEDFEVSPSSTTVLFEVPDSKPGARIVGFQLIPWRPRAGVLVLKDAGKIFATVVKIPRSTPVVAPRDFPWEETEGGLEDMPGPSLDRSAPQVPPEFVERMRVRAEYIRMAGSPVVIPSPLFNLPSSHNTVSELFSDFISEAFKSRASVVHALEAQEKFFREGLNDSEDDGNCTLEELVDTRELEERDDRIEERCQTVREKQTWLDMKFESVQLMWNHPAYAGRRATLLQEKMPLAFEKFLGNTSRCRVPSSHS